MDQKAEALKEETQKSLKETQDNMGTQVKTLKEETQKSLKEIQENYVRINRGSDTHHNYFPP